MIPIFIPSYNRAGNIRTTQLLDRCGVTDYKVVVRPSQYDDYAKHLKRQNLLALDAEEGLSYAREFIRKRVKRGQWCLHMDDNVRGFGVPDEKFYRTYDSFEQGPGSLTDVNNRWYRTLNSPNKDFIAFYHVVVEDTMREADKRGAVLCGFSALQPAAMRPQKWRDVGYVCGKVMLMKNVRFPWRHISVSTGEDYALTAAHLLEFGRVLINKWGYPKRTHYEPGGCGTYEERLPEMIRTSTELMERYPGLFRWKTRGPKGVEKTEGELRFRLHNLDQVARWREAMLHPENVATASHGKVPRVKGPDHSSAPRGHHYCLVNETLCRAPSSPQAAFILKELRRAGKHGMTRAELVDLAVKDPKGFPTNQPHERAIGFFLSKFKGAGGLAFAEEMMK
jgi:hypothetical protein